MEYRTDQVITIQLVTLSTHKTALARFSTKQVDLDLVLPDLYALLSYRRKKQLCSFVLYFLFVNC